MYSDISKFSYTLKDLKRNYREKDLIKYSIDRDEFDYQALSASFYFAENKKMIDKIIMSPRPKGKNLFTLPKLTDNLIIRQTSYILSKFFRFQAFSRDQEVKQFVNIIKTEPGAKIVRTDLKSFYENIVFQAIISSLELDGFNNIAAFNHLKKINKICLKYNSKGIPRGMSISAYLANYAMKSFDRKITAINSCCYYCRYVDDILLITTNDDIDLIKEIESVLPKGIILNLNKTEHSKIGEDYWIEYLGYSINLINPDFIKIAETKISRTKKRIILSFKDYLNSADFELLKDRICFLSSNTVLKMHSRTKPLTVGFRYSYSLTNTELVEIQMKELDNFLWGIIYSKRYNFSRLLRKSFSQSQIDELKRLSFYKGYVDKITYKADQHKIYNIKRVWAYA